MSKSKTIGITGGIGSGKSLVSRILASTGVPVYNSDYFAKKLYEIYPDLLREVVERFGEGILDNSGSLDRSALASIVFDDEQALSDLNALVHPRVREHFEEWSKAHAQHSVLVKEAAILIESGAHKQCDVVWLVVAPEEVRIQRVIERDLVSRELVKQRINKQWSDEQKMPFAQTIISNDGQHLLIPQVIDALNDVIDSEQG